MYHVALITRELVKIIIIVTRPSLTLRYTLAKHRQPLDESLAYSALFFILYFCWIIISSFLVFSNRIFFLVPYKSLEFSDCSLIGPEW